jgi:hypothetical protein
MVNETCRVAIHSQVCRIGLACMSTTVAYTATLHHVRPVVLRFSGLLVRVQVTELSLFPLY